MGFGLSDLFTPFKALRWGYDKAVGPTDQDKARQELLNSMGGRLAGTQADNDARRKEGLRQSFAFFDPVNSVVSKMYGPGAVGPGIDIDALFSTSPAGDGAGGPLAPGWDPRHQTHTMFDPPPPLAPGWDPRHQTHTMFGNTLVDSGRRVGGRDSLMDPPPRPAVPAPRGNRGGAGNPWRSR